LSLIEDRLVPSRLFLSAALLDDVAEVEAAAPPDVFDRLSCPRTLMRATVAVEPLGDLGEGVVSELGPDPSDDRRLLGYDFELARMAEVAAGIAQAGIAQRVVPWWRPSSSSRRWIPVIRSESRPRCSWAASDSWPYM
jgi:hypothetical protein